MTACDCSLKHINGGVCNCTLSYTDLFGSEPETDITETDIWEQETEEKEDVTKITKKDDDWFVQ